MKRKGAKRIRTGQWSWAGSMDEMRTAYIKTEDNVADLMTKIQPKGERRERLLSRLMWDIYASKGN
jgi:hypothetical protein